MWNLVVLFVSLWPAQQLSGPAIQPEIQQAVGVGQAGSQQKEQKPQDTQDKTAKPAPKADKAAEPQAGEKAEQAQEEGAKPSPPQPLYLKPWAITLGFADWNLSGNENKFRHYGTPPRSFFAQELLFAPKPSERDSGYISLRAPGESDYRHDGRIALFNGRTQAELLLLRNEFYEATPFLIPGSRRRSDEGYVKQLLTRDFSFSMRYQMQDQHDFFEAPLDPLHQRTRYWDAIGAGKLGNGQIKLGYTDWRYFDRTLTLFDTKVTGWRLGYMWMPTLNIGAEATYANLEVKQPGQPTGHLDFVTLSSDTTVGQSTDLGVLLRRDRLSLPIVSTAYAREQRLAQFSLAQSYKKWNARLSISQRDVERVRADNTFVDVPQWTTFEGRLDGRLTRNLRLTVRGYTQDITDLPPMTTADPRSLYWSSRQFVQVRLQHTNGPAGGYFVWTYRNWDNDARAVNLDLNSFVVGGNWQVTQRLSLFAEYTKENWNGKSDITTFPTFRNFLPDSHVIAAGLDWMIDPRAFLSLNVTNFGTNNDNPLLLQDGNTNGLFFSINSRYIFPSGNEVGLTIAPWTYRDDVRSAMNYDAAIVMLTGKLRF
jgi:hypothetical protein